MMHHYPLDLMSPKFILHFEIKPKHFGRVIKNSVWEQEDQEVQ